MFLFIGAGDTLFTYMGRVILNGEPFQEEQVDVNGQIRKVWMFPLKLIDDIENIEVDSEEDIGRESIDKRVSIEDPPPKGKRVPPKTPSFKGRKTDFNKQNKNRKIIGDKGEIFVLDHEVNKLLKLERKDLANQVERVSETQGDGTGYDIKSYDEKGNEIFIEVKTTTGPRNKPFNISWVEFERSKIDSDKYYLYRVYNFNLNKLTGRLYKLKGNIGENFHCNPIEYQAYR